MKVMKNLARELQNWCAAENWQTVLAAGRETAGIKEEKDQAKALVGECVMKTRGRE